MAYGNFRYLAKRITSHKILRDKAFNIDGYETGLASIVYKFFDKKLEGSGVAMLANKSAINNEIKQNLQLAEKLNKPIIRNFK